MDSKQGMQRIQPTRQQKNKMSKTIFPSTQTALITAKTNKLTNN